VPGPTLVQPSSTVRSRFPVDRIPSGHPGSDQGDIDLRDGQLLPSYELLYAITRKDCSLYSTVILPGTFSKSAFYCDLPSQPGFKLADLPEMHSGTPSTGGATQDLL
jgi:hypothetical protein